MQRKGLNVENAKVLEIGTGFGDGLRPFLLNDFNVENLNGVDLMPARLEIAKKRVFGANFFHESGHELKSFHDNSMDLVTIQFVFCHIPSEEMKRKIAQEILRVLKSGGFILILDWKINWKPRNIYGPSMKFIETIFRSKELTTRNAIIPTHIWPNIGNIISKKMLYFYPLLLRFPFFAGARYILLQKK